MKDKTLTRFIITYLLFFMCVIIMLLPLYQSILTLFTDKTISDSYNYLKAGVNDFEKDMNSISTLIQKLYSNPGFKTYAYMQEDLTPADYINIMKTQSDFNRTIQPIRVITDCGIVFNNGLILTSYRTITRNEPFYNTFFKCGSLDFMEWKDLIGKKALNCNFIDCQTISSKEFGNYEAITFTSTLPMYSRSYVEGLFYATISKEYLLSKLAATEIIDAGFMLIKDMDGTILMNYNYNNNTHDMRTMEYRGTNSGITVTIGIPVKAFAQKVKPVKDLITFYLLALAAVGIVLSITFAYKNSKPVKDIISIINNSVRIRNMGAKAGSNDFVYIAESLKKMDKTLEDVEGAFVKQEQALRSNLIERLIRGLVYTEAEFKEVEAYFPDFPRSYSMILVDTTAPFSPDRGTVLASVIQDFQHSTAKQVLLISILESHQLAGTFSHFTDGTSIVILFPVSGSEDAFKEYLRNVLHSVKSDFQQHGIESRVAYSGIFHSPQNLSEAFNQIKNILRLVGDNNSKDIWSMDDFPESSNRLPMDYNDMQRLYEVLLAGEKGSALLILDKITQVIHVSGFVNEMYLQQIFYNIRSVLLRLKYELFDACMDSLEIPSYHSKSDVDSMLGSIRSCCIDICSRIEKTQKSKMESYTLSLLGYIDSNFADHDLYAKSIAEHFQVSESHLQKVIRAGTGKSLFEYIEDKRLEKASELLKSSGFSINDIAEKSGFSSQNSFYKAFKRRYNLSPSAMRVKA